MIYKVKTEPGKGRPHVLHRNLLLPCNYLQLEVEPGRESRTKKTVNKPRLADKDESSPENDDDEDYDCHYLHAAQHQEPVEENNKVDNT